MKKHIVLLNVLLILMSSCGSYLNMKGVAYQSLRQKDDNTDKSVQSSSIIVSCTVGTDGAVNVYVKNNTDNIMTIDRTKTFFTDADGLSTPYYDPTLRTTTTQTTISSEKGASVNLGTIANAVGVGGRLGTALNGVNVSGSSGVATANSNTTIVMDQPIVSVAPHGKAFLARTFYLSGVGTSFLQSAINRTTTDINNIFTPQQTYASCNVTVSYSFDDGKTYDKIETFLFANTLLISKVKQTGKLNEALRNIYTQKPDALREEWYMLYFGGEKPDYKATEQKEFINFK